MSEAVKRLNYLGEVLRTLMQDTHAGDATGIWDGARCDGLCLSEDFDGAIEDVKSEIETLKADRKALLSLTLRMVDRWWCFVHGSLPSETARALHTEAVETINGNRELLETHNLEQQIKGVEFYAEKLKQMGFDGVDKTTESIIQSLRCHK